MIEARKLRKVYAPKKGVEVRALDDVSLRLPDTGMVFILGKSGSGKSTLLNVLGGLDTVDSGEIIIKGQSSSDFKQSHFDSYRNTYVGFIFQEYNILEEFTVGANIALAIELQGRKATNGEINEILHEVELDGLGNRKPNELSGGQKQRVAIARALVKKPEIIMADEPTGALDSATGRQVFDTLKKLSKTKLVLVVSHDREFSELYADRIIELSDGKIISDVEYDAEATENADEPNLSYLGKEIIIKDGYELTDDDRIAINDYIRTIRSSTSIIINDKRQNKIFKPTDEGKIENKGGIFKLIKSKLSLKNAFKLGSSGLKHKKVRLVFTIFLSFIAFSLFGLADTIASYNSINTCTESLIDSNIDYVSLVKAVKDHWGDDEDDFSWKNYDTFISASEKEELSKELGLDYVGVISGIHVEYTQEINSEDTDDNKDWSYVFPYSLPGVAPITPEFVSRFGYKLTGQYPQNENEIVITKYIYEHFHKQGYILREDGKESRVVPINNESDLIGKTISSYSIPNPSGKGVYKIVGILDTGFDFSRYEVLADTTSNGEMDIAKIALQSELRSAQEYSLHAVLYVTPRLSNYILESTQFSKTNLDNAHYRILYYKSKEIGLENYDNISYESYISSVRLLNQINDSSISWTGDPVSTLSNSQILISSSMLHNRINNFSYNSYDLSSIPLNKEDQEIFSNFSYGSNLGDIVDNFYLASGYKYVYDAIKNNTFETKVWPSYLAYDPNMEITWFRDEFGNYDISYTATLFTDNIIWSEHRPDDFMEHAKSFYEGLASNYPILKDHIISWERFSNNVLKLTNGRYMLGSQSIRSTSYAGNLISIALYEYSNKNYDKALEYYISTAEDDKSIPNPEFIISNYAGYLNSTQPEEIAKYLKTYLLEFAKEVKLFTNVASIYGSYKNQFETTDKNMEIVGVFENNSDTIVINDDIYYSIVNQLNDGIYSIIVAPMPKDSGAIRKIAEFSYTNSFHDGEMRFELKNSVTQELDMIDDLLETLGEVFLYIGLGFALFASLMLSNFIATSISYKKQEIGILRAIGSRSRDVFKIFFAESFIISIINFVLSLITTGVVVYILNGIFREDLGILVTFLTFGARQGVLLLGVSLLVAFIATFLPVKKIASMKPIDAIKNRK